MSSVLAQLFPNYSPANMFKTSESAPHYNCIAWACEDDSKWYWPDPTNLYYWPQEIPRQITLFAFEKLFELLGYTKCANGDWELGYLKIAIYIDSTNNRPTHAARQISDKFWTSKLGEEIDVAHTLDSMQNGFYGNIASYMKRSN